MKCLPVVLAMCLSCLLPAAALADLTPLETLGRHLLFDTNLSTPPGQPCAACHAPEVGFTGPVSSINAHGTVYPGAVHTGNSVSWQSLAGPRNLPAGVYFLRLAGPDQVPLRIIVNR